MLKGSRSLDEALAGMRRGETWWHFDVSCSGYYESRIVDGELEYLDVNGWRPMHMFDAANKSNVSWFDHNPLSKDT